MAGNWNYGDPGGGLAGWGGPPQLHAPEIGTLAAAIMRNRLEQSENFQKQLTGLGRTIAEQRAGNAAMDAAKTAGLTDPGDLSGMGSTGFTDYGKLADLIDKQKLSDLRERVANAHADLMNQQKKNLQDYSDVDTSQPLEWTDPVTGKTWYGTRQKNGQINWRLEAMPVQPNTALPQRPPTQEQTGDDLGQRYGLSEGTLLDSTHHVGVVYDAKNDEYTQTNNRPTHIKITPGLNDKATEPQYIPLSQFLIYKAGAMRTTPEQAGDWYARKFGPQGSGNRSYPTASPYPSATPAASPANTPDPNQQSNVQQAQDAMAQDSPTPPPKPGQTADDITLAQYIRKYNGNRELARRAMQRDGWVIPNG